MLSDEEFEFKKPEEDKLPGEEKEISLPPIARHSMAGMVSTACAAISLFVFLPRIFYINYFRFALSSPESFGAVVFLLAGLVLGIVAFFSRGSKPLFRHLGFWANLAVVLVYLLVAF